MMRRGFIAPAAALVLLGLAGSVAVTSTTRTQAFQKPTGTEKPRMPIVGNWKPPHGLQQLPIWPGSPPDMDEDKLPPEHSETAINPHRFAGLPVTGIYNVSTPTMTIFRAKRPGRSAAVIVFPGGGFQQLAIDLEGTEACDWLTARGITCVLLKYRVPKTDHYWDQGCNCAVTPKHLLALQDAQRTIRLVRAHARSLNLDPRRIGVIGFSAGGYLVAQTSNIFQPAYKPVDAFDLISSRPDFAVALYPGHLCRVGQVLDPAIHVTRQTPTTFLVQAWNDPTDEICNSTVYARALDSAGVPTEVHLFASGGHAFGLRPTKTPVDIWPMLLERWLREIAVL
jgi:acetyl esterase/lipase